MRTIEPEGTVLWEQGEKKRVICVICFLPLLYFRSAIFYCILQPTFRARAMHPFTPVKMNANDAGDTQSSCEMKGRLRLTELYHPTNIHIVGHLPACVGSEIIQAVLGKN